MVATGCGGGLYIKAIGCLEGDADPIVGRDHDVGRLLAGTLHPILQMVEFPSPERRAPYQQPAPQALLDRDQVPLGLSDAEVAKTLHGHRSQAVNVDVSEAVQHEHSVVA